MSERGSFFWGCLGGAAPELLRMFKLVSAGSSLPLLNWHLYPPFLLAYILLAGAFSVAFEPDSKWKALWAGASLPALIAALEQGYPFPKS
jgi:hypothetical protein